MGKLSKDSASFLGMTEEFEKSAKKDCADPWEIKKFEDCKVIGLSAGLKSSFVFTEVPKEVSNMTKHRINDEIQEEGILHFYIKEQGKLVMLPPSQYQS